MIPKTFTIATALFTAWLLSLPAAFAQDDAAAQLAAILRQTRTLEADVEQLILDQDGRELQETRGRLALRKPDHFHWEIIEPYSEVMVTNGETIWRHEPDLDQVTIQAFEDDVDRTPILLLNGNEKAMRESYDISATTMTDPQRRRFILTPKEPDSLFERLSLTFLGPTLEEMQFESSLGQKTSLRFTNHRVNGDIDPGLFDFEIPAGVEVIDTTDG